MTRRRRRPSKLLWKLFLGYAVLMTLALVACVLLILKEFEAFYAEELTEHLTAQAIALRSQVRGRLNAAHAEQLDQIAKEVGGNEADGVRVTFVAVDGTVLGDSQADVSEMESHRDRTEIRAALQNGRSISTRWSTTVSRMFKYVAVRVGPLENPEGVVRVALGIRTMGARTQSVRRIIWEIAIIALVATVAFALVLARLWSLRIRRITAIARRISRGDLSARARVRGSDELAGLAQSLNEMRDHLRVQLGTIDGQRRTFEALLDQLQEGVIVAGPDGKIVMANPAAARMLHQHGPLPQPPASWAGQLVEQHVPQHDLQRLLLPGTAARGSAGGHSPTDSASKPAAHADRSVCEVRVELPTVNGEKVVLAAASDINLPEAAGPSEPGPSGSARTGRILALTDITETARTMQMKTQFVANASHELRTPLSAIRGAIETVLNMDISTDAEAARRFLGVIDRHSARLEALVGDLLALSRLESPAGESKPTTIDFPAFCNGLRDRWAEAARKRGVQWESRVPPDLGNVTVDPQLASLALDNLVDNAIKFTAPGGHVTVTAQREPDNLIVEVADNGCGIPVEDQPHVFERFYQLAPARSGTGSTQPETRGTGLGLSIVRHAVAAMKGTVHLQSEPGKGTTVILSIPQPLAR